MRLLAVFIVAALLAGLAAGPLRADTDYRCLNDCVQKGGTAFACMPKCTYGVRQPSNQISHPIAQPSGKEFNAPIPSDGNIIMHPHHTGAEPPGKDYSCVVECERNGLQYQLCNEKCTKSGK